MKIEVTAFPRTSQGKGASRRLRTTGRVPGVIYGAGVDAQSVEFDHKALLRHLKLEAFHSSILDLTVEGKKDRVLLRWPSKPVWPGMEFREFYGAWMGRKVAS